MPGWKPILFAAMVAPALMLDAGQPESTTVLRFNRVWDGTRVIDNATIVVRGTRIVSVGSGRVPVPADAREVDLRRYTAVPGLIDLHTHMTYYWNGDPATKVRDAVTPRRTAAETAVVSFANATRTLETGVTSVRDLGAGGGADVLMRDAIIRGEKTGPRMFVAGSGLSRPRTGPYTTEQWQQQVAARVQAGADWIKVYGSRGSYESVDTTQTLTFDDMKAIVDAAHAAGKPVAIHSYGGSGIRDAVRAGADSVEHGIEVDAETLAEMKRRGTVWVPTIDHNRYYVDAKDEFGFAPETIAPLQDYIRKNLDATARAVAAGVKIGMGSDAVYSMFGQNTRELGWLVKAGLTPTQALQSATTIAADLLGRGKDLGRLAPGYFADIVAIEGDPTTQIEDAITGVRWVMKDGKVSVDRR